MEAVLFDMDGTLVETEQHWGTALHEFARRLGGRLSDEARAATVGTSMRTSMTLLHDDLGLEVTDDQLLVAARWVEGRAAELLAGEIIWRPGARELLEDVRSAALPTALVTTTPRPVAELVLRRIDEAFPDLPPFDVTVCGDEVPARKPDPAPYRQAMGELGVDPARCVVVEDSLVGVTAGLAAGAAVLGVPSLQALEPAPGLVLRDTLAGVGVAELADVLAARDGASLPA
ncbi:HAD family phosphatase [Blastococcus jejuensis]|uniref:HAD family hydrolase n=1 Tax=Blastococcus jejuensis TaxID=351224 RepID=UPI0031DB8A6E